MMLLAHRRISTRGRARKDAGYAMMLVIFLTTLLLISLMAAAPSVRVERQREKEQEMIWRGKQYVRAIRLFYLKNGRFPTELDDLTKPKQGSLRFLRQAYKDPMNKEDGSWRLIYVGPAGQLIGSLKPPQTMQMPGVAQVGTPAAALNGPGNSGPGGSAQGIGSIFGGGGTQQPGAQNNAAGATGTAGAPGTNASSANGTAQGGAVGADDASGANPSSLAPGDNPTIMGGNIIGVGSKINKKSIMVYEKARNYRLFEFVWDPSKDLAGGGMPMGAPGAPIGTPAGAPAAPGAPGTGGMPGSAPAAGPGGAGSQPMTPTLPPTSEPPPSSPPSQP